MTPAERQQLVTEITMSIKQSQVLTDDEQRWVKMAIQKEAQAIAFRRAVIEKSLAGLVWAAIVFVGTVFYDWAVAHGFNPGQK
jgi:hypothetical protein